MNLKLDSIKDNNFYKSIVSGICVSLGCICYLSIENKIVGAFLFSVGIISIITYGLTLYTGRIGVVKSLSDVIDSILYLFGNMCGSMITYCIMQLTPIYNKIQEPLQNIVAYKTSLSLSELFILGMFCGALMLFATKNTKNLILPVLCIAVFILIGAEHSVANSFYMLATNDVFLYLKNIVVVALGNATGSIIINKMID